MKIIVFGGAGFIGSSLVAKLHNEGHEVSCGDNYITGRKENLIPGIPLYNMDINDKASFKKIDFTPDLVIHLAFPTSLCDRNPDNQFENTASTGTLNVLEFTRKSCNRIVYGSSISVYGEAPQIPITEETRIDPMLIYGASKYLGELYVRCYHRQFGTSFNTLRISDTFGERDLRKNAINNFIRSFIDGSEIIINGDGNQLRTYTYVADMANAIQSSIHKLNNTEYNIAAGNAISINELLRKLASIINIRKEALYRPEKKDSRNYVFDCSKFTGDFGEFEKTGLDEGLKLTVDYLANPKDFFTLT